MKINIITPTHNTKYIPEVYESLKAQVDKDWEWYLVFNGEAHDNSLPQEIIDDKRVIRVQCAEGEVDTEIIGSVKKFAFSIPKEGILVELDHDDLLTPTAVQEIRKAFKDLEVGFAYSDCAEFWDETWAPFYYSEEWGWKKYKASYYGHDFVVLKAFEPTPHSMSKIYYAPNHVRCWRKEVYDKIGGHNPTLKICDDLELLIRTYLNIKMKLIPKCLYLYRNYKDQSFRRFNKEIQKITYELYDKNITKLVQKWCKDNNYPMIDLGGGYNKPDGYTSIDLVNGDITADLNKTWPLKDNSVGVIRANDIFEHLKDKVHVMNEAYRVLVDGGWLMIEVPSTDGRGAYQDPTHISFWNSNSFWYFTKKEFKKYVSSIKCRFSQMRILNHTPSKFHADNYIIYTRSHMVARKGKNYPGGLFV